MTLTDALALWGALTGTGVLLWEVFKWHRDRPQLVAKVQAQEFCDDITGIHYEIINRGSKATTVDEIKLVTYHKGWLGWFGMPECVINTSVKYPNTVKLPARIEPGDIWKGFSSIEGEEEAVMALQDQTHKEHIRSGTLHYKIRCTHTDRLLSGRVRLEGIRWRI